MALWQYNWWKALYHLDWNANDSSWNWYNWEATNVTWVWWKVWSWCVSLTNWYINCLNPIIPNSHDIFTFHVYAKMDSWVNNTYRRLWWNISTAWYYFQISNTNKIFASWYNPGNEYRYDSVWSFTSTDWTLFSFVKTWPRSFKIYVNWEPIATTYSNTGSASVNTTWNWHIWTIPESWTTYAWKWLIDEYVLEYKAFSDSEVKKYYTSLKWRFIL